MYGTNLVREFWKNNHEYRQAAHSPTEKKYHKVFVSLVFVTDNWAMLFVSEQIAVYLKSVQVLADAIPFIP